MIFTYFLFYLSIFNYVSPLLLNGSKIDFVSRALKNLISDLSVQIDANCFVLVRDNLEFSLDNTTGIYLVITELEYLEDTLRQTFSYGCDGYIVQLKHPEMFLKIWGEVRITDLNRHNPKIIFLPCNDEEMAINIFKIKETNYLTDIIVAHLLRSPTEIKFELFTNYFYTNDFTPIKLGIWPDDNVTWFLDKTSNLNGKVVRCATLEYPPYTQINPKFDGMEIRLVQSFCEIYNCTVIWVTDDNLWGEIWGNKSGNGVLGNVYTEKADLGSGAVYSWYNVYKYLDYSYPYLESRVTALVPKPKKLPEWLIPIIPFSTNMWAILASSILAAWIVLYFVNKITTRLYDAQRHGEFTNWSGVLLRSIGMAVLQPPIRLQSGSVLQRFFTLFEFLFLLFTTIYSGALSSVLTVPIYSPPINCPFDLYKSGIRWFANHDAWVYSLKLSTEPYIQELLQKFKALDTEKLIEFGQTGSYGFTVEIMAGGHVTHTAHLSGEMILKHHVMKTELYRTPSVTIFRKGSPLKKNFDYIVHLCLDAGLFLLWEGDSTYKYLSSRLQTALKISEAGQKNHNLIKLKINHVQGAFIVLAIGLILAMITFLAECFSSRKISVEI